MRKKGLVGVWMLADTAMCQPACRSPRPQDRFFGRKFSSLQLGDGCGGKGGVARQTGGGCCHPGGEAGGEGRKGGGGGQGGGGG